jgi:hypothetical protein
MVTKTEYKIDMVVELDTHTPLSHIVLENPLCRELVDQEGFDSGDIKVEIKLNGIDFSPEDFNAILEDWHSQTVSGVKRHLDFNKSEEAVKVMARKLIEDKMSRAREVLDNLENDLWRLEE